ncbi:MAG: hypothetical protein JXC36_07820 [Candidatus Atribacteria bacterium]|nr:hypothetical protein [Candidatus Atribacteria bacterium]
MEDIRNYYLMLYILASFVSCSPYNISNMETIDSDKNELYQILYYASLAGSSHNSQPWKLEVYGVDSILVFADVTRNLPVVDPTSRELYISIGAFIENLNSAASCYGYKTDIKINTLPVGSSSPVASIALSKFEEKKEDPILNEIKLRTTLRPPFDTTSIK